jgi:hypothetical protein
LLSVKQASSIITANSRINLWEGAVRSAKTWSTLYRWIRYMVEAPKEDLLIVGKTRGSAVRNIIKPLQTLMGSSVKWFDSRSECYVNQTTLHLNPSMFEAV